MSVTAEMARLRWACRRGMLELDLILLPFFEHKYPELTPAEQQTFVSLVECNDQELYNWFIGRERPNDDKLAAFIIKIIQYAQIQT